MSYDVSGIQTQEGGIEVLSELLAGAIGTQSKLRLYHASFSPGPTNVEADFETAEATFTGYTSGTITWDSVGLDSAGVPTLYSDRAVFQAGSPLLVGNVVGGLWLSSQTSAGPPAVNKSVVFFPFPVPINVSVALQTIAAVVALQQPGTNGFAIVDS